MMTLDNWVLVEHYIIPPSQSVLNLPTELEDTTQVCMYINLHIVSQFLPDAPI